MFVHRSSRESPAEAEAKAGPPSAVSKAGDRYLGMQPRKQQSLVIEDYYCVSVEPPDAQVATTSELVDALEGTSCKGADLVDSPLYGHDSSFASEGEGPAQWLAAPKADLDHAENHSMESAEETSESESEWGNAEDSFCIE